MYLDFFNTLFNASFTLFINIIELLCYVFLIMMVKEFMYRYREEFAS